jgi:hypothetical protein
MKFHQSLENLEGNMWQEEGLPPFDELIFSWNGPRPKEGRLLFYLSLKIEDGWSPPFLYACWGSVGQRSFQHRIGEIQVDQDIVEVRERKKATGFKVEIKAEAGANREALQELHVYVKCFEERQDETVWENVSVPVSGLSQIALNHMRRRDLCSPSSTIAVIRYLLGKEVDPLLFAEKVRDEGFDIFGNWVLNVAQASAELGSSWRGWVERLKGFQDIYSQLQKATPVIISVRGPLKGSAYPYAAGHLLVVTGYDAQEKKVCCVDPAFASDAETKVMYDLSELMEAWNRRGKIAYIFSKRASVST